MKSQAIVLLSCVALSACAPIVSAGSDQVTSELSAPSLSCGGAPGYQRTLVPEANHCLWWPEPSRSLTYFIDSLAGPREALSVFAAFHSWNTVAARCSDLTFSLGQTTAPTQVSVDDAMFVAFRQARCIDVVPATDACWSDETCDNAYRCWDHARSAVGVTTVSYSDSTGRIVDADIELNAAGFVLTTVDSPSCPEDAPAQNCVAMDLQGTLTHEIGHAIGLDHVFEQSSLMYPQALPGLLSLRNIDASSACFVCETYPAERPSRDCRLR